MASVTLKIECNGCGHKETAVNVIEGRQKMRQHANEKPGHQVSLFWEHMPDGGRDYIDRAISAPPSRPARKG